MAHKTSVRRMPWLLSSRAMTLIVAGMLTKSSAAFHATSEDLLHVLDKPLQKLIFQILVFIVSIVIVKHAHYIISSLVRIIVHRRRRKIDRYLLR